MPEYLLDFYNIAVSVACQHASTTMPETSQFNFEYSRVVKDSSAAATHPNITVYNDAVGSRVVVDEHQFFLWSTTSNLRRLIEYEMISSKLHIIRRFE
jgi:hypothetical protein